jgi:hypothetical protein
MIRASVPVTGLLFVITAVAAEPDLSECLQEQSDAGRLACYDRVAIGESEDGQRVPDGATSAEQPAPAIVAGPAGQDSDVAAREAVDQVDNFGMNDRIAEEKSEASPPLDEITATIVAIETRRYGERILTLDNGQVWEEEQPQTRVRLEVGDLVRIKAGALGSFKLFGSTKRSTRVERVR